jgi:hypothetical protein
MADRFLKHMPSGHVFIYADPWIGNTDFTEVANAAGDPLPEEAPVVNPPPKARRVKPEVDETSLSADASRGLAAKGM